MTRIRWAAWCWILCVLTFPAQVLAALQWPQKYSWSSNLISDLGVTACGLYNPGTGVERLICSPWHLLANGSTVANGLLLAAGSALLWSAWPNRRQGQWAMALLLVGGLLVSAVGLLPWDLYPAAHETAALLQAFCQWAGMVVLILALGRGSRLAAVSRATALALLVSVAGFILFLSGVGGGKEPILGLGAAERLAFDSLTLWGVAVGCLLLRLPAGRPSPVVSVENPAAGAEQLRIRTGRDQPFDGVKHFGDVRTGG
ncbi:DUF998 domain-containing protein [Arthrobacter sp. G119Y2]|uniref:DUF998 domain-containing protein n=1 Tax=Arthrobacter sp. G119Y2 TaxID=3134965 RepID=UPI00311A53E0